MPPNLAAEWIARLDGFQRISDSELHAAIESLGGDEAAVSALIGALACRGILSDAQADWLLANLPDRFPAADHAWRQVMALKILRDSLRTPNDRLRHLLDLKADWAAALIVPEIGPYNCGEAFAIVRQSSRPDPVRSELCAAIGAHQKDVWAQRWG